MTLVELALKWKNNDISEEDFIHEAKLISVNTQNVGNGNSWEEVLEVFKSDDDRESEFYSKFIDSRIKDSITLVLENVETFNIPAKYVSHLQFSHKSTSNFVNFEDSEIESYDMYNYVVLAIDKKIDELKSISSFSSFLDYDEINFKPTDQLLNRKDICYIDVYLNHRKTRIDFDYVEEHFNRLGSDNKNIVTVETDNHVVIGIFDQETPLFKNKFEEQLKIIKAYY